MSKFILAIVAIGCLAAIAVVANGHTEKVVAANGHTEKQSGYRMVKIADAPLSACMVWGSAPRERPVIDRPWTLPIENSPYGARAPYCLEWSVRAGSGFYQDATGIWRRQWVEDIEAARKSGIQLRNASFVPLIG